MPNSQALDEQYLRSIERSRNIRADDSLSSWKNQVHTGLVSVSNNLFPNSTTSTSVNYNSAVRPMSSGHHGSTNASQHKIQETSKPVMIMGNNNNSNYLNGTGQFNSAGNNSMVQGAGNNSMNQGGSLNSNRDNSLNNISQLSQQTDTMISNYM